LGRYPQPIVQEQSNFLDLLPATVNSGIPSQLLANRPDIKQAELELVAAKLDVKVARAEFYPSLGISAGGRVPGIQTYLPVPASGVVAVFPGRRYCRAIDQPQCDQSGIFNANAGRCRRCIIMNAPFSMHTWKCPHSFKYQ
jgi:hypothetical protein